MRFTAGDYTASQALTVIEDPRVTKSGVTDEDLRAQFDHNMRVRDLVSEANHAVARVRAAQKTVAQAQASDAQLIPKLNELASRLITPPIRYSKPELQTHITYLYTLTNNSDQKIGQDAVERYAVLRKELDERVAELNHLLGPAVSTKTQ